MHGWAESRDCRNGSINTICCPVSAYIDTSRQAAIPGPHTQARETILYNIDPPASKEAFLKFVQDARASDPDIGRFESIRNAEELYEGRPEMCVLYRAASKDYSARAVRGGQHTVFETIGMHCVHQALVEKKTDISEYRRRKESQDAT